jgi:CheY-like chemotaxis protein
MLCEDNDLNAEIATTILRERAHASVERFGNGRLGLDAFASSAPGAYDAILMDLRMPVMGGIETAKAIRALDRPDAKTVPIVAMTADAFVEDVRKCQEAGMNAHVPKPVEPSRLISVLAEQLAGEA